jgi:hypothetical protein
MLGKPTRLRALLGLVLVAGIGAVSQSSAAEDKKADDRKEKTGSVAGVVTAKEKDDKWIEVKADGEEKPRRYVPQWINGPDKEIIKEIGKVPVGARIKLDWKFDERARVVKIEVLKLPAKDKEK